MDSCVCVGLMSVWLNIVLDDSVTRRAIGKYNGGDHGINAISGTTRRRANKRAGDMLLVPHCDTAAKARRADIAHRTMTR